MSDPGGKSRQPSAKHALDEVLKSLQDLVRNELAEERAPLPSEQASRKMPPAARPTTPAPATSPRTSDSPADAIPVLTDPIGRAIPGTKTATRQAARAPVAAAVAKPIPADGLQTELPLALVDDVTAVNAAAEDIPVLQHVVVPPPVPIARERTPATIARRIANEVATRLAAELGRAGTSRLEPAIIRRLEDLLREALEKQAAESLRS